MEKNISMSRPELLQVADTLARDKGIDREEVLQAIEQAIQKAGRLKYGADQDIRAHIDRKNGEIILRQYLEVVEVLENESTQLTLKEARRKKPDAEIGEFLTSDLPPIDFGRIAAQTAKQVMTQKVRDAERLVQFNEYKGKVGQIINGTVKRIEMGNVIVDLGKTEAYLRRDELIGRETFRINDRIRAYIMDVRQEIKGPQIFLSRSHPEFLARLFTAEVPEIYDGIISIKAVARDPGSRAKIAVQSKDNMIDPVGACVGVRGSRVQAVVNELQGEKIDIIEWSNDPAVFIVNALAPAEVSKVVLDAEQNRIEVVVPSDQLSLAIGRKGQNVKLASQLTGWHIDIMTEADESERRQAELKSKTELFISALDVDDVIAHLLVTEGFNTIEEVAYVVKEDLLDIEGFDEDVANELQNRAKTYLSKRDKGIENKLDNMGVSKEIAALPHLNLEIALKLAEAGIKDLDDVGDLAADELIELIGDDSITLEQASEAIMKVREDWFDKK